MSPEVNSSPYELNTHFNIYHELMPKRVRKILLVFSPYDAFIMEESGSLASRIANEYHGLNLSDPPRLTRVSTGQEAVALLREKKFDLVITAPQLHDTDCFSLGMEIKNIDPKLPVILLEHNLKSVYPTPKYASCGGIDRFLVWSPDPDFLMAMVKNIEDHFNVDHDTREAMVRVLILVEDSPLDRSRFLPLIYKEIVKQTQAVMDESLNAEHRLLKMRARPKILVVEKYEEALALYRKYQPYVFGIISDIRFPRQGRINSKAGLSLLARIRKETPDLPLLLLSSDAENRREAEQIPAVFLDKNSPDLLRELHSFFLDHLGFGDFVFRLADGGEVDRASNLGTFEKKLSKVPDDSLVYHAKRNHFSNWVMARSEVALARELTWKRIASQDMGQLRHNIISTIHKAREMRQSGVVGQFYIDDFDADIMDFVKIGQGAMGGKALGLAFMADQFKQSSELLKKFPNIIIAIPKTLVITTDGFDSFVSLNNLVSLRGKSDETIAQNFIKSQFPAWLKKQLEAFLAQTQNPLIIRSSSVLEDALFKPYAGLYKTYMIPNNSPDFSLRVEQLLAAIKLVYASTYYEGPRAFSKTGYQVEEEGMGIIIQPLIGGEYGDFCYPAISGVAQSYNYYPVSYMKPEEGIAHIALGLGKTVVEGEQSLRFSPKYPRIMPQFSTVEEILVNSQRSFYALRIKNYPRALPFHLDSNLEKREITDAQTEFPVQTLTSTYFPDENRIRDVQGMGPKILTFAQILKNDLFPLPQILSELLTLGQKGMGCSVEIEFAVNLNSGDKPNEFFFLQIRPMVAGGDAFDVRISEQEIEKAFCYSDQVLGYGKHENIADIIYIKPDTFNPKMTRTIAQEINRINARLAEKNKPYLLIGPGRWGSADPWLGIPVKWQDISGVSAMVEIRNKNLKADPSQGTHFFQNITALNIPYFTITEDLGTRENKRCFIDWQKIYAMPIQEETQFLRHARAKKKFIIKVDGKLSQGIILQK